MRDVSVTEPRVATEPELRDLARVAAWLENQPATTAIRWARERFGTGLVVASSFQDAVLIDLVAQAAPSTEIVFLDTGFHFAETQWFVEKLTERYDLNLTVVTPEVPRDDMWAIDPDTCCRLRKVEPLARALSGRAAWMSGLRRSETLARRGTPVVTWDLGRGLVKVNPIATWTDADVESYVADRGLPVHPLSERGYASIGCWPCTRPSEPGDDPRSGRWQGLGKTECGLHT